MAGLQPEGRIRGCSHAIVEIKHGAAATPTEGWNALIILQPEGRSSRVSPPLMNRRTSSLKAGVFVSLVWAGMFTCASLPLGAAATGVGGASVQRPLTFERDIRPIFKHYCLHCHGEDDKLKGGLDLRLRRFLVEPHGKNGDYALIPGKSAESELLCLVKDGEMPPKGKKSNAENRYLKFLEKINSQHLVEHPGESDLEARIASYALAGKLQTSAKEVLDISGESAATKKRYGIDNPATAEFGTRCLIARRLVERGVRFVQLFTGNQTWDHHRGIIKGLPEACAYVDQGAAALVIDLKQRRLLDSIMVHLGGEMGRLPVIQFDAGRDKIGRDNNTYGFSVWVAGGGFKAGLTFGETDEFAHKAVKDIVTHHDYHATLLHLFGLDHTKLTYERNGVPMSLTNNKGGRVVTEILA